MLQSQENFVIYVTTSAKEHALKVVFNFLIKMTIEEGAKNSQTLLCVAYMTQLISYISYMAVDQLLTLLLPVSAEGISEESFPAYPIFRRNYHKFHRQNLQSPELQLYLI